MQRILNCIYFETQNSIQGLILTLCGRIFPMCHRYLKIFGILNLGVLVILGGCASTSSSYRNQPSVDPTSIIQINTDLEIPNGDTRVYIQNGVATTMRNIDRWATYCGVAMKKIHAMDQPKQTVSPGRFEITRVIQSSDHIFYRRVYVASRIWRYDPPSSVNFQVEMRLDSASQPDVRSLICVKNVNNYGRHFPKLAEIKVALGDAITIISP